MRFAAILIAITATLPLDAFAVPPSDGAFGTQGTISYLNAAVTTARKAEEQFRVALETLALLERQALAPAGPYRTADITEALTAARAEAAATESHFVSSAGAALDAYIAVPSLQAEPLSGESKRVIAVMDKATRELLFGFGLFGALFAVTAETYGGFNAPLVMGTVLSGAVLAALQQGYARLPGAPRQAMGGDMEFLSRWILNFAFVYGIVSYEHNPIGTAFSLGMAFAQFARWAVLRQPADMRRVVLPPEVVQWVESMGPQGPEAFAKAMRSEICGLTLTPVAVRVAEAADEDEDVIEEADELVRRHR